MPKTERQIVLESYSAEPAKRLVEAYFDAGGVLHSPEHWAGQFLARFGFRALSVCEACAQAGMIGDVERIRELIADALDAELAAKHGRVTCHACEKVSAPTHAHRYTADESGRRIWACPLCAPYLCGAAS